MQVCKSIVDQNSVFVKNEIFVFAFLMRKPMQRKERVNGFTLRPRESTFSLSLSGTNSTHDQCDQIAISFFNIWSFRANETLPNSIKNLPKEVENVAKYWISQNEKIAAVDKCCLAVEISPDLITLHMTHSYSLSLSLSCIQKPPPHVHVVNKQMEGEREREATQCTNMMISTLYKIFDILPFAIKIVFLLFKYRKGDDKEWKNVFFQTSSVQFYNK